MVILVTNVKALYSYFRVQVLFNVFAHLNVYMHAHLPRLHVNLILYIVCGKLMYSILITLGIKCRVVIIAFIHCYNVLIY